MKIIPAIDILGGKCVRLTQGDYHQQKIYAENPLDVAKVFEDHGIERVHLVDLDGARSQHIVNYKVLEQISKGTTLHIDFGGGLKSEEDLRIAFNSGAHQITGGSIALKKPWVFQAWLQQYGPEKIILGADCRQGKIATDGWLEASKMDVLDYIRGYVQKGIQQVICTDIACDGMLNGPSYSLYQSILAEHNIDLIASGGIASLEDLKRLQAMGCYGAIVGKAIYENRISLQQISQLC